jgi:DNA-binding winged helix-turn-helix (wHTH) protein/Tol biopolymer transport system component
VGIDKLGIPVADKGKDVVSFGSFEADLRGGELRRNGSKVRLQEQPFQLLTMLLENPGEIVTREELRKRLWPANTFVDFDHGLNAAVKRLRDALGDSAENPRFVETLARRGYRFVAPVTTRPNGTSAEVQVAAPRAPQKNRRGRIILATLAVLLMGSGAGWVAARRLNPKVQIVEQRLTANAFDDPVISAVISPDSKYLAFADRSGLFLRVVGTGETHSIALPIKAKMRPTSWFPDGNHLLAVTSAEYEDGPSLWSVSVLGGSPRRLLPNARDGSVSPDGSQIVFIRGNGKDQEIWLASALGEQQRKVIGQAGGRIEEQLYREVLGNAGEIFGQVVWSPDGSRFAFTRYIYRPGYRDGDVSLGICDPSTNRVDFVLSTRRLGETIAWTADNRLVYSLTEPPPNQRDSNLWVQQVDIGGGKLVGEAKQLTSGPDFKIGLSFTADGKRLTFLRRSGEPHLYISQLVANQDHLTAPRRLSLEEGRNLPFTWTPDSKSLVFISDREGPFHLFKQALDQAAPDLLVDGANIVMGARLNPDGTEILYLLTPDANDPAGQVRVMRMPVNGGTPQLVLQEPMMENIQCARLPSKLCLFSRNEAHAIRFFRFDSSTGEKHELTQFAHSSELKFNWTLSADGSMLAIAAWRVGQVPGEIQIFPMTSGKPRTITLDGWVRIAAIDWAADSRNLWVSASDLSGVQTLLKVDLHGKATPMLQDAQQEMGWAIPSPDGQRIAIWQASGSANVWSLQGF